MMLVTATTAITMAALAIVGGRGTVCRPTLVAAPGGRESTVPGGRGGRPGGRAAPDVRSGRAVTGRGTLAPAA